MFSSNSAGFLHTGTVSEVFRLKEGDRVQVGDCTNANYLNDNDYVNTFSGVLVKADN